MTIVSGACVSGRVHDDRLDGTPAGLVGGARGAGSVTVVAALPPLPEREGFVQGALVSLLKARARGPDGGAVGLAEVAELVRRLIAGECEAATLAAGLPPPVLAAFWGRAGLDRQLEELDAELREALAEALASRLGEAFAPDLQAPPALRRAMIRDRMRWLSEAARAHLAPLEAATEAPEAAALHAHLTAPLPDPFALLPDPDEDPVATGCIRYGTVIFHDPAYGQHAKG